MMKRDVIRLVEHGSGMRVVGMTGGNVNINNGVSTNLITPCYDSNTKPNPVPPVTPVISLDHIRYSGSSSQLYSSPDFLLIVFSIRLDSPH